MWLGACVVEQPYVIISQIATTFYFSYFIFFLPLLSYMEKRFTVTHKENI